MKKWFLALLCEHGFHQYETRIVMIDPHRNKTTTVTACKNCGKVKE